LVIVSLYPRSCLFAFDNKTAEALTRYIMAGIHEKNGNIDLAVQEYKNALKIEDDAVIHLALATAYIKKNQIPSAIEEINRAIVCAPESAEPHAVLALLYFLQNNPAAAEKEYETALQNAAKLLPNDISIIKNLGFLYFQQKNLQAAENIFRSIIGMSYDDYEAHFYLASLLEEQKNRAETIKELKIVLELNPDYHPALNYLGYLYVEENKNLQEAEKLIAKALELDPENGAYIDSLGWLYFKQGKNKEAIKELERSVLLLEDPVIFDHLGDVYFKIKNFSGARNNWDKSFKLDQTQARVKQKIEALKVINNKQ